MKRNRGFTLIELLVVIAIIGILASIILASLSTAQAKGRDAKRVSDIKQIQLALELYYDANGYYPMKIYTGGLLVSGGFIPVMPYDSSASSCTTDGGAGCYSYAAICSSDPMHPSSYHLGASLEQGGASLNGDVDAAKLSSTGCTGGGADFSGADTGKCSASDVGSYCFDVKP